MTMKVLPSMAAAALACCALVGCRDEADELSSSEYVLGLQHKYWRMARQSLKSDRPNLDLLRAVERSLSGRSLRAVEQSYPRANKQEVMAKLKSISAAYAAEVLPKVDTRSPKVRLRPGATLQQVREAFAQVDIQYQELEALTAEP